MYPPTHCAAAVCSATGKLAAQLFTQARLILCGCCVQRHRGIGRVAVSIRLPHPVWLLGEAPHERWQSGCAHMLTTSVRLLCEVPPGTSVVLCGDHLTWHGVV